MCQLFLHLFTQLRTTSRKDRWKALYVCMYFSIIQKHISVAPPVTRRNYFHFPWNCGRPKIFCWPFLRSFWLLCTFSDMERTWKKHVPWIVHGSNIRTHALKPYVFTCSENVFRCVPRVGYVSAFPIRRRRFGAGQFGAGHFGAGTIQRQNFFFRFVVL